MKIAVLLTTFNRREKTIACLDTLKKQELPDNIELSIYLTDAASSDNTVEAVKKSIPSANVFSVEGLYWAGGMRYTWSKALEAKADYYFLLNDDTLLYKNALAVLIEGCNITKGVCIGNTVDPKSGNRSYGGKKLTSKRRWKDDLIVFSETEYLKCDVANANIMLVAKEVVEKVGILSSVYTHGLADFDYALRVNKAGLDVFVAPGYLGTCVNDHGPNWKSGKTTLKERINYLKSPKGLAYSEYMFFIKRHFPLSYPIAFCNVWMKTFFPFIWQAFRKSKDYGVNTKID